MSERGRKREGDRERESSERLVDVEGFIGSSVFSFCTHKHLLHEILKHSATTQCHPTLSVHPWFINMRGSPI